MTNEKIEHLNQYLQLGFNLIPIVLNTKKPPLGFEWTDFQHRKDTDKELTDWFGGKIDYNIAIVCGKISGNLTVVDFDNYDSYLKFFEGEELATVEKSTFVVESTPGHRHVYIRAKNTTSNTRYDDIHVDIRGEGGYIIAPPSKHSGGYTYHKLTDSPFKVMEVEDITVYLNEHFARLGKTVRSQNKPVDIPIDSNLLKDVETINKYPCYSAIFSNGVGEGVRDDVAFRFAVFLRHRKVSEKNAFLLLNLWNERNHPPLNQKTLIEKIHSAYEKEYDEFSCEKLKQISGFKENCTDRCPTALKEVKKKNEEEAIDLVDSIIKKTEKVVLTPSAEDATWQIFVDGKEFVATGTLLFNSKAFVIWFLNEFGKKVSLTSNKWKLLTEFWWLNAEKRAKENVRETDLVAEMVINHILSTPAVENIEDLGNNPEAIFFDEKENVVVVRWDYIRQILRGEKINLDSRSIRAALAEFLIGNSERRIFKKTRCFLWHFSPEKLGINKESLIYNERSESSEHS